MSLAPMNVVVISEGPNELGKSYKIRDYLRPVPYVELGALEILIVRLAKELFDIELTIVGLPRLPRVSPGHVSRASLTNVLQHPDLLKQVLLPCFKPVRQGLAQNAAQGAIVACDQELCAVVTKSVEQVKQSINSKIIQVVFQPEFEVLLLEKDAIEQAARLPNCSVKIPDNRDIMKCGGLKEAFVACVCKAGYTGDSHPNSSDFKAKIAECLTQSFLASDDYTIAQLRGCVGKLLGRKKRPSEDDHYIETNK